MDVLLRTLTSTLFWWIVKGAMSNHLRLEPPGSSHAFFTGDNFFVTCLACEECRATRLTWQSPSGRDITNSHGRVHVEPAPHSPHGLELVVEDAKFKDRGTYTCSAIVDGTEVRTSFSLYIHQSISFSGTPEHQFGIEGDDYLLRCNVRSDPAAIISWYVNGTLLLNGPRHTLTEDGVYIRSLNRSDASNYTCRAFVVTPHSSQMKDLQIHFEVHYRPVWRNVNAEVSYGMVGSTSLLLCEAHAQPPPVFEWFRDRTLIGNNRFYRITNHRWKSILQVKIAESSAFGIYVCVASNSQGEVKRDIALVEGVYPGRPSISIHSKEPGTLLVKMHPFPSDRLQVLGFRIQCRQQGESWSNAKEFYVYKDKEFLIPDLSLESVYVVRVKSRNAVGYSNYSEEMSHLTKGIIAETVMGGHTVVSSPEVSQQDHSNSSPCFIPDSSFLLALAITYVRRQWQS